LAGAAFTLASAARAQPIDTSESTAPADDAEAQQGGAGAPVARPGPDFHRQEDQDIVVTGFRRNRGDILSGTSVLAGEDLARNMRPTIGETLAQQPGVSATSFGPNASRPVLRGFQGDRVRILTDGIGSLDVSNTSVDHAVSINPLTAERIEVLRGPGALLFGSAAIGGVVNVIDARIPRHVPDEAVHADGILTYGSAADERSANAAVDVPIGGNFVLHADGNYVTTDDLEIGGHVLSRRLREQAAASADPDVRALADLRGHLPNSAARTWEVAGGLAWIDGGSNAGLSISRYNSLYGVPVRYSLDPAVEAEEVRLDIKQTRIDGRAEIDAGSGWIDMIRLRGGWSNYRHFELEETGEIGTTFRTEGMEGRAEVTQNRRGAWGGGFGAQYFHRDFDVEGEEKFLPPNHTGQIGLFTLQTLDFGHFKAEAGARYEHSSLTADADADIGNPELRRSFDAVSGSIGASYALGGGFRIGLNGSHAQRAPSAEELFADGPHAGTQAFEVGDPGLSLEKSWGLEASLRGDWDGGSFGASVFGSWFDNYIYQQATGAIEDDLPVFQYFQGDARYFGIEFEGSLRLGHVAGATVVADVVADYVRATIEGVGPAPRIPPFRVLAGLEAQSALVNGRIEVEQMSGQDRLAPLETSTPGFTMVNASLSFHPFGADNDSTITLSANNIFDVEARRHASFLKDYAPLPGRDLRVTAHVMF
jgi:iron complex outermembrane receptor protein